MLFNFVIDLLKMPRSERSDSENETVCKWLMQSFQIFSKIDKETVDDIVNNSKLSECELNSLVIKQGDRALSFFLIIDGKVSIYINTDATTEQCDELTNSAIITKETNDNFVKITEKSKFGNFIGFIEAGSGFGEMALLGDDVRNATIISEEDCLFLVLDKVVYNRSLRMHQEAELQLFTSFVNSSPIFHNWQPRYKKQAAMSMRRRTFPFDREIIKQGDKINGITFIIEGQAKVIMDITMHCQQYPDFGLSDQLLTSGACKRRTESLVKSLDKVMNVKHLEISLVGPGEIIGDIEQAKGLETSCKSLIPIELTEVYFLDEKNYERLITSKRNQTTGDLLRKWVDQKLLSQYVRPTYKQLPLINHLVQSILQEKLRIKEQQLDAEIKKVPIPKASDFIARGPLIDMFGPGTVFYRNRLLRKKKLSDSKAVVRKQSESTTTNDHSHDEHEEHDKYHISGLERDPTFVDWETSTNKLDKLETKILSWYETDTMNKSEKVNIPRLQRFVKRENETVKPGKTILLKPRKSHKLSDIVISSNMIENQQDNRANTQFLQ